MENITLNKEMKVLLLKAIERGHLNDKDIAELEKTGIVLQKIEIEVINSRNQVRDKHGRLINSPDLDLSKLSTPELKQYHEILMKAQKD